MMDELGHLLSIVRMTERPRQDLDERLRALEDRTAIRELILTYGYLCDRRAWDALMELYTDDVERILAGTLHEHVVGKQQLLSRYLDGDLNSSRTQPMAEPTEISSLSLKHMTTGEIVRLSDSGDDALAVARTQLVATRDDPSGEHRRGVHEASHVFHLRRVDGSWKISKLYVYSNSAHNPLLSRSTATVSVDGS